MAALDRLRSALEEHTDVDRIIWFQTDPLRELRDEVEEIPPGTPMPASGEFVLTQTWLNQPLINLQAGKTTLISGQVIHDATRYYRVIVDHVVGQTLEADKLVRLTWRTLSEPIDDKVRLGSKNLNLRNRINDSLQKNDFKALTDVTKIIARNLEFLNQSYHCANSLGHDIYCIGGLSKLNLDLIGNYPNLKPVIPSVLEMLYPEYKHADIVSGNSDWRQELMSIVKLDAESVDYFYQQYTLERVIVVACQEYFYPDGVHPNRKAHLRIYEKLKETIGI